MKIKQILPYAITIIAVVATAVLGSYFTSMGTAWLDSLNKPSMWPPSWLFGVVWSVIYTAFAALVFYKLYKKELSRKTIILLAVNAVLNVLWCIVFFALGSTLGGLVVIIINLLVAWLLIEHIYKHQPIFGIILLIYPLWLSVATALNSAIWILN